MKKSINFTENRNNGIFESIPQGEYGGLSEADSRMEEISNSIRRCSETSLRHAQKNQGTVPGSKEVEEREVEKYGLV